MKTDPRFEKSVGPQARGQQGFLLLAVLFMLAVILLTLSIAAPTVALDLRRDKEQETIERGKQYMRAIRLYYRKFGRYPNTIDQLVNTDNQRFLRKRYLDPLTGKDDWRLIHVGEAHVTATGLFGQPLGSTGVGGVSPTGISTGSSTTGSSSIFGAPSGSTGIGSGGTAGTGPSGSSLSGSSGFSLGPSTGSSSSPFGSSSTGTGTTSAAAGSSGNAFGSSSSGSSGSSSGLGSTATGISGSGTGTSGFGTPGSTFGGAPIVGVGVPGDKASIKIYKKQARYNLWEFVYDPNQELAAAAGLTGGSGITPTGASSGANSTSSGFGGFATPNTGIGSSGAGGTGFGASGVGTSGAFGGSSGSGSNSGTATTPASPTTPNGNTF